MEHGLGSKSRQQGGDQISDFGLRVSNLKAAASLPSPVISPRAGEISDFEFEIWEPKRAKNREAQSAQGNALKREFRRFEIPETLK
jgi:hypothetical protein